MAAVVESGPSPAGVPPAAATPAATAGATPTAGEASPSWSPAGMLVGGLAVLAVIAAAVVGSVLFATRSVTREYVIPAGTGARLDAGQTVDVLPQVVRLSVGDKLVVRNDDDRTYNLGLVTVRPGETVRRSFPDAGTYLGDCTLNPSGDFKVIVG